MRVLQGFDQIEEVQKFSGFSVHSYLISVTSLDIIKQE